MSTTLDATHDGGGNHDAHTPPAKFAVNVSYNGTTKAVEVNANAAVQATLQHAIREFGVTQNAHVLSLFTAANVELQDNLSLADQGVQPGAHLLLRPSTVKGGSR